MKILFLIVAWLSVILLILPSVFYQCITVEEENYAAVAGQADAAPTAIQSENADRKLLPSDTIAEETVSSEACDTVWESAALADSASSASREEVLEITETAQPPAETAAEMAAPQSDCKDSQLLLTVTAETGTYRISMREYLVGVVMAEMPSYFHTEALRAQAVAARSYLLYRCDRGYPILDYGSSCTAYFTEDDGRAFFGDAYGAVLEAVTAAVEDTDGEVLFYDGKLVCAAYHAMSYAYTADAAEVWGGDTPYLVSVKTPEQESLSGMVTETVFDEETLCRRLGVKAALPLVMSYSGSGRVSSVETASGDHFSGERFRSLLRLRSTSVTVAEQDADTVTLYVRGWGHGVGMSQYGADIYADGGWTYKQILSHYYPLTTLGLHS